MELGGEVLNLPLSFISVCSLALKHFCPFNPLKDLKLPLRTLGKELDHAVGMSPLADPPKKDLEVFMRSGGLWVLRYSIHLT